MSEQNMREALYWETLNGDLVKCTLCPQGCQLSPGQSGLCRGRCNVSGRLMTKNYGQLTSLALDPIEKKPLKTFYPGTQVLSFGSFGCNLTCLNCQNYEIAHGSPKTMEWSSEQLVQKALELPNTIGLAATYNEPTISIEFVLDTFRKSHTAGLKNVFVSNGFIQEEPLEALLTCTDAFNIDLKGFSEAFYRKQCGGSLEPVQRTLRQINGRAHLEVTCLIIPGLNDSESLLEKQFQFISELSPTIPVHISRYFPMYKSFEPETPIETLKMAKHVAEGYLKTVFVGNISYLETLSLK